MSASLFHKQQSDLAIRRKNKTKMNAAQILKRIIFEITFVTVIVATVPLQVIYATGLVTFSIVTQYPAQIHQLLINLFYAKKDS
jgi:hypothetical protein